MDNETLIIELLKRTETDVQELRKDFRLCIRDINQIKLKVNTLENSDGFIVDPIETKRARNKHTTIAGGAGASAAGIIIAGYELIKNYFAG